MDTHYWLHHWHHQQHHGFDQRQVNPFLLRHLKQQINAEITRVFIPLCGQSIDMHWLWQQGHDIIAVEISEKAVLNFFAHYDLPYTVSASTTKDLMIYETPRLKIVVGDYFALEPEHIGVVDWVYDRAAFVAFPEEMRVRYAKQLQRLVGGADIWLLNLHYQSDENIGPPFSVEYEEIARLFSQYQINELEKVAYTKHKVTGVLELIETLYWMTQRPS